MPRTNEPPTAAEMEAAEPAINESYACPACGGTDLRAEVPATVMLHPDGTCELIDFEAVTQDVGALREPTYNDTFVCCQGEDCEHEGTLPEFEVAHSPVPTKMGVRWDAATREQRLEWLRACGWHTSNYGSRASKCWADLSPAMSNVLDRENQEGRLPAAKIEQTARKVRRKRLSPP